MSTAPKTFMPPEDFLDWEAQQPTKHEYLAGEVFAMVGASDAHVTIALNVASALRDHLRGTPCRVYISDMKLEISKGTAFFYPDVFVTCAAADARLPDRKREPLLVIEILSPSTAAFDRGLKFAHYRTLPSLQEYALIESERRAVDLFRRDRSGAWVLYPYQADARVQFASIGLELPLEKVYEDLDLGADGMHAGPQADGVTAP